MEALTQALGGAGESESAVSTDMFDDIRRLRLGTVILHGRRKIIHPYRSGSSINWVRWRDNRCMAIFSKVTCGNERTFVFATRYGIYQENMITR